MKATGGDTHLGGEDFDNDFVNFLAQVGILRVNTFLDLVFFKKCVYKFFFLRN